MTTEELIEKIESFRTFSDSARLFAVVRELSGKYELLNDSLTDFFPKRTHTNAEKIVSDCIDVIETFINQELDAGFVIRGSDEAASRFRLLDFHILESGLHVDDGVNTIFANFSNAYSHYLKKHSLDNLVGLLKSSNVVYNFWRFSLLTLTDVQTRIDGANQADKTNNSTFSVRLNSDSDFEILATRLRILNEIYILLCKIFDVSPNDNPLKVVRVESGSWWIKLFGESKVVMFLIESLKEAAGFMYRNYTSEGRYSTIQTQTEGILRTLDLRARMEAQGIPTARMDGEIEEVAALIAVKQRTFLANDSAIAINAETIDIKPQELVHGYMTVVEIPTSSLSARNTLLGDGSTDEQ